MQSCSYVLFLRLIFRRRQCQSTSMGTWKTVCSDLVNIRAMFLLKLWHNSSPVLILTSVSNCFELCFLCKSSIVLRKHKRCHINQKTFTWIVCRNKRQDLKPVDLYPISRHTGIHSTSVLMFNVVIESSRIKIQIILIQMVVIRYKIIKQESKYKEYNRCISTCGRATSYFIGSPEKRT